MIPESTKSAQATLKTLRSRCGYEDQVVGMRVKELKNKGLKLEMLMDQAACYTDLIGNFQRQKSKDLPRFAFIG